MSSTLSYILVNKSTSSEALGTLEGSLDAVGIVLRERVKECGGGRERGGGRSKGREMRFLIRPL